MKNLITKKTFNPLSAFPPENQPISPKTKISSFISSQEMTQLPLLHQFLKFFERADREIWYIINCLLRTKESQRDFVVGAQGHAGSRTATLTQPIMAQDVTCLNML